MKDTNASVESKYTVYSSSCKGGLRNQWLARSQGCVSARGAVAVYVTTPSDYTRVDVFNRKGVYVPSPQIFELKWDFSIIQGSARGDTC